MTDQDTPDPALPETAMKALAQSWDETRREAIQVCATAQIACSDLSSAVSRRDVDDIDTAMQAAATAMSDMLLACTTQAVPAIVKELFTDIGKLASPETRNEP